MVTGDRRSEQNSELIFFWSMIFVVGELTKHLPWGSFHPSQDQLTQVEDTENLGKRQGKKGCLRQGHEMSKSLSPGPLQAQFFPSSIQNPSIILFLLKLVL